MFIFGREECPNMIYTRYTTLTNGIGEIRDGDQVWDIRAAGLAHGFSGD